MRLLIPTVFADALVSEAEADDKIIGITAAMPDGTGLKKLKEKFPERCFDVGIAEQHAVTFAAGLACEGYKPFVAIYSTFLQRGYDQLVHDVAIQNLPVRFALDRAGLVGADGQTHAGSFDIAYLCCLPNFVVMAPADEAELIHAIHTVSHYDKGPIAVRFPRGDGQGVEMPKKPIKLKIGKGRIIQKGKRVAILTLGPRLYEAIGAADLLAQNKGKDKINPTIADARFAKPVDADLLEELVKNHDILLTVEEGSIGGFSSQIHQALIAKNLAEKIIYRPLYFPDKFIDHASQTEQYQQAGLDREAIARPQCWIYAA